MAQATGLLGLRPWEFWQITPREFANMLDGYRQQEEQKWQRTAQLASWIMSAQLGNKAPSADKLLGKNTNNRTDRQSKVVSIEEKRKVLRDLEQALGEAVNQ
jgi:hypothetical protein